MLQTLIEMLRALPRLTIAGAKHRLIKHLLYELLYNEQVREFNAFRELYPDFRDLRGIHVPRKKLRYVNFEGMDLSGSSFRSCDLNFSKLGGAQMDETKLEDASLCSLQSVIVGNNQLRGIGLRWARLDNAKLDDHIDAELRRLGSKHAPHEGHYFYRQQYPN